jgi:hypothetical protein
MTNPNGLPTIPEGATVIVDPDAEPFMARLLLRVLMALTKRLLKNWSLMAHKIFSPTKSSLPQHPDQW